MKLNKTSPFTPESVTGSTFCPLFKRATGGNELYHNSAPSSKATLKTNLRPSLKSKITPTSNATKFCLASKMTTDDIIAQISHNRNYKRNICKNWFNTGSCRYGTSCQFAHG